MSNSTDDYYQPRQEDKLLRKSEETRKHKQSYSIIAQIKGWPLIKGLASHSKEYNSYLLGKHIQCCLQSK